MPSYDGTLAAVRCLGDRGIPVTVAGDTPLAPARWSRYVTRWVSCPPVAEPERYLEWLVAFGKKEPGHVLYPTSDDLAWLFARHAHLLRQYFRLYQPPAATLLQLLDKKALYELCTELEIPSPRTLFPTSREDALAQASELGFPLVLKPRTQMFLETTSKGGVIASPAGLAEAYDRLVTRNAPHPSVRGELPRVEHPMLQSFVPDAAGDTYSISGFIAPDGGSVVRAAIKLLQRPRQVGVGVCFEEAAVDPRALADLQRLAARVGYFGVFEAEFVRGASNRLQLIDFNPRFFGQMGFDVARDMPLPYLAWLGAVGDEARLRERLDAAQKWQHGAGYVYRNSAFLRLTLFLQGLSGGMSAEERQRWRHWLEVPKNPELAFDLVDSPHDPLPGVVSRVREVYWALRHPRAFFRKVVMGGAAVAITPALDLVAALF
ncbi:MAG TPA: hypothetical protein VG937_15525 [Polyangiaceae bacterium]|nr:hypothetical protein [Polyangiaceae bacterium]